MSAPIDKYQTILPVIRATTAVHGSPIGKISGLIRGIARNVPPTQRSRVLEGGRGGVIRLPEASGASPPRLGALGASPDLQVQRTAT